MKTKVLFFVALINVIFLSSCGDRSSLNTENVKDVKSLELDVKKAKIDAKKTESDAKKVKVKESIGFFDTEDSLRYWEIVRSSDREFAAGRKLEKSINGGFGNKYRFLFDDLREYKTNPYRNGTFFIKYSNEQRKSVTIGNHFLNDSGNVVHEHFTIYEKDGPDSDHIYMIQSTAASYIYSKETSEIINRRYLTDEEILSLLRQCSIPKETLDKVVEVQQNAKISYQNIVKYNSQFLALNKEIKLYPYASEEYINTFLKIKNVWRKYSIAQEYYKKLPY